MQGISARVHLGSLALFAAAASLSGCSGGSGASSANPAPAPSALSVSTGALPNGQVGAKYSTTLAAAGGTPPYHWALSSGSLPAGLVLTASSGLIAGTPSAAANAAPLTVQVTDSGSPAQSSSRALSVTIAPAALVIVTKSLPVGEVGIAYGVTLGASGGTAPYTWSISAGALAAGLSLAPQTGAISGTPTAAASASLTFQLKDSSSPPLTRSVSLPLTVNPPLTITANALTDGQVGKAYAATLTASGGTPPLAWTLVSGTLPAGLSLAAGTGMIAGTPTAAASAALAFAVQDSNVPAQQRSVSLALDVSPASISVAITPPAAGLSITQSTYLSAATNDYAGVRWSISPSGGAFVPAQSSNGASVTFTAPGTAGLYTVTAASITDPAQSSSISVGVTALPGMFTYRDDAARDGVNSQEYALTTANVGSSSFGKLFSCVVDGAVYAQPLWVANVTVNGAQRNLVIVATAHDSLFAFDADASPCVQLWSVSLIDAAHGATAGETTVPAGTTGYLVGVGDGDITPEVGVIGTPVIDPASGTVYVVSKSVSAAQTTFYQRLHAIDLRTGDEKAAAPIAIQGTYPGTGDSGTTDTFNPRYENQRSGLALVNGTIYIAWAAHEDAPPYYGWLMGYTYGPSGFTQISVLNVTPNVGYGGIWMGGAAPSADAGGNLYLITGNGGFDANSVSAPNNDYGDSLLELSPVANPSSPSSALAVGSWFTPSDELTDQQADHDFGSGGAAVLADVTGGSPPQTVQLVVGGGKDGNLYLLDRAALGGFGDGNAWQEIETGYHIFSTAAVWNDTIYLGPFGGPLTSYALQTSSTPISFVQQAQATSPSGGFGFPGPSPSISANGTADGVVWALDNSKYCTNQSSGCGPAVLHAYSASSLAELWNSSMAASGADAAGNAVKFTVPCVANGKVYVGTRGNNTGGALSSSSAPGELDVYGLKPN